MSYLISQTRASSLFVGGVDYTSWMVEWSVSDESAMKRGCLQTSGTLTLGSRSGGVVSEDYDRDHFRRGTVVTLDVTEPGGASYRHPRGYLYVITTSYDIENEQLQVELGCRLVLMALTEEIDDLIAITPISLDIAQTTYSNCSAAFASRGQYVFQNNEGDLVVGEFFDGDGYGSVAPGDWVSVLGVTATSVSPLQGSEAIPDIVELSYQVPSDGLNGDEKGRVDTVETESYYFTEYPAVRFKRYGYIPNPETGEVIYKVPLWVSTGKIKIPQSSSSGCGNTPPPPKDSEEGYWTLACLENWITTQEPVYIPATSLQTSVTTYDGPGAQVSSQIQEFYGPALDASPQHYADRFAYCRSINAVRCLPDGNCPMEGMDRALLTRSTVTNYYGDANEIVRVVSDTYATVLSAAQPSDWRSGVKNGVPQDFKRISVDDLYRTSRVDTVYYKEGSINVQKDTIYQSLATSRGVGIGGEIDALNGLKTVQIRRSATTSTVEIAPDRANSATTATEEKTTTLILFSGRYTGPSEAGPYIIKEQIPVPLLFDDAGEIDSIVNSYSNYLERFLKGDRFGLQIAEALRGDVSANWHPGMPFRYYDPSKDRLLAMRMDATSWGVSTDESAFVTNGIWIGESNATVVLPKNLQGNSQPDMGQGGTPPPAVIPPSVDGETSIDSGSFAWSVDVHFGTAASVLAPGRDGVIPALSSSYTENPQFMIGVMVQGFIVGPGDVLETEGNGGIPLEDNGNLVVVGATIVDSDLFA